MRFAAAIAIVLIAGNANAQDAASGNRMLGFCKEALVSKNTDAMHGVCLGAISAILYLSDFLDPRIKFCKPATVTAAQGISIAVRYMENHPELLHQDFQLLSVLGFMEAWPCK